MPPDPEVPTYPKPLCIPLFVSRGGAPVVPIRGGYPQGPGVKAAAAGSGVRVRVRARVRVRVRVRPRDKAAQAGCGD